MSLTKFGFDLVKDRPDALFVGYIRRFDNSGNRFADLRNVVESEIKSLSVAAKKNDASSASSSPCFCNGLESSVRL